MGIFDFWKAPEERRASEVRRGSVTPSRNERQRCWEARDTYFACLDRSNILDAVKDAEAAHKACPAEEAAFERDCAKAWVTYFKQWRVAEAKKQKMKERLRAEGAIGLDVEDRPGRS